jgi:hypothetical protein
MADNFDSISFPLEGKTLRLRISYQLIGKPAPKTKQTKQTYRLEFEFKYIENTYAQGPFRDTWPTVKSLSEEMERLVLSKVLPLLGKNVQVTGLSIAAGSHSVLVNLYAFGLGEKNAVSFETSLYFVLQPFKKKTSYRLYVKGASLEFLTTPLNDVNRAAISSFETLFVSVLSLFDGSLLLQYVRDNDLIVSSVFKEGVKFRTRPSKRTLQPNKTRAPRGRSKGEL